MRRLILVAGMSLPHVESAVAKFAATLAEKTGKTADYELLFGRVDYPPRLHHRTIAVMLGVDAFRTNASFLGQGVIGILLDNPMTLGCITVGENVKRLDFRPKPDGTGIYFQNGDPEKLQDKLVDQIRKGYVYKGPERVTLKCLDRIPNTLVPMQLGTVSETTTFAKEFAALNYSVRNELDRDRIRRALFAWVRSTESTASLSEKLTTILGKQSKRVQNLVDTFDPGSEKYSATARNIRQALTASLNMADAGKNSIPFDKIADKYGVSAYDLRYATFLFKKDPLLISDTKSSDVHYNNSKFRTTGAAVEAPTEA